MIMRFIVNGEVEHEERAELDIPQEMMPIVKSLKNLHVAELVLDKDALNEMDGSDLTEDIVLGDIYISGSVTEFGEPVISIDATEAVKDKV